MNTEDKLLANELFRKMLEKNFLDRKSINPQYSIRAFAKTLNISSSALSAILNGKRTLTSKMCLRLGTRLGLSISTISDLSEGELGHAPIEMSRFAVISDWYHYAILELLRTKDFKPDIAWIAKKLGISSTETILAVKRLKEVGLLRIRDDEVWEEIGDTAKTNIQGNITSEGARKLQKQVLEKAIKAIDELPIGVRNNTSITIAMHPTLQNEIIEKIKIFRRSLAAFIEEESEARGGVTHVYNLGIALYPLTNITEREVYDEN